jgi:ankyrin repeat protein
LLEKDAKVDEGDNFGLTPFHLAAESENLEAMELLVKKGSDFRLRDELETSPFLPIRQSQVSML